MATDRDVLPSFLGNGGRSTYDNGSYENNYLRIGEVQELIPPSDPRNVSKRFNEYSVYVSHKANGITVGMMYDRCIIADTFGGLSDSLVYTLRPDTSAGRINGSSPSIGVGSRVLILCINGEGANPVIIGGVRNANDAKDTEGHHLDFNFNGVRCYINPDGELEVTVKGATDAKDQPAKGTLTDKLPTTVKIAKNGDFSVSTKNGENSIVIEQNGKITVTGKEDVTVNAKKIHIGKNADEKAVLGDTLVSLLSDLLDTLSTMQSPTSTGTPTGFPIQAPKFRAIKAKLKNALSTFTFVKKSQ